VKLDSQPKDRAARVRSATRRVALVLLGLYLFVVALELLKKGAGGLGPLLRALDVSGVPGGIGFGWIMASLVLSGSPVAAIALTLLASRTLTVDETFAMIGGSRLGASFVVLVVGVLDDVRGGRTEHRSAYIGVVALVVTAAIYAPALGLGYVALQAGVFQGLRIEGRDLASVLDALHGPITRAASAWLPRLALFGLGGLGLLGAFRMFDAVLPDLQKRNHSFGEPGQFLYRPMFMFVVGLAVTTVTLSVSVSLSLLVPLAGKGYIRRENVFPYIMGANITTFVDTLLAGALVGHPDAVRVVAVMMVSVTALSLPVLLLFPYAFERWVDRIARRATASTRALLAFVGLLFLIPLALLAL
jgi:solute carrier family 34 (sodium-dependent phosphate cotransporter)